MDKYVHGRQFIETDESLVIDSSHPIQPTGNETKQKLGGLGGQSDCMLQRYYTRTDEGNIIEGQRGLSAKKKRGDLNIFFLLPLHFPMGLQERLLLVWCVPIDAVASAKLYRWALAVARRILYERAAHNSSTQEWSGCDIAVQL
jgi:hypothetical protein